MQPRPHRKRRRILTATRLMLDSDIAALFELPVRRINEQMKRNPDRFPEDFCFQLTQEEVMSLSRSQFAITMQTKGGSGNWTSMRFWRRCLPGGGEVGPIEYLVFGEGFDDVFNGRAFQLKVGNGVGRGEVGHEAVVAPLCRKPFRSPRRL